MDFGRWYMNFESFVSITREIPTIDTSLAWLLLGIGPCSTDVFVIYSFILSLAGKIDDTQLQTSQEMHALVGILIAMLQQTVTMVLFTMSCF
jgi:hypothetical protein